MGPCLGSVPSGVQFATAETFTSDLSLLCRQSRRTCVPFHPFHMVSGFLEGPIRSHIGLFPHPSPRLACRTRFLATRLRGVRHTRFHLVVRSVFLFAPGRLSPSRCPVSCPPRVGPGASCSLVVSMYQFVAPTCFELFCHRIDPEVSLACTDY